jgi:hypothetical protein
LVDREIHDAVKTDRGEDECDRSENDEQIDDDAIAGKNLGVELSRRAAEISWNIRIKLSDGVFQYRTKRVRTVAGAWSNDMVQN